MDLSYLFVEAHCTFGEDNRKRGEACNEKEIKTSEIFERDNK